MEYNWSIEKIRNHKRQLRYLLRYSKGLSSDKKEELKQDIKRLIEMKKSIGLDLICYPRIKNIRYVDSNRFLPTYTLQEYMLLPSNLKKATLNSIACFRNFEDCYENIELPKINLTDQELVDMSYDFYCWLPKKSYQKYFCTFTNPKNHLLRFVSGSIHDSYGLTQFFYYPSYQPYFSICRENTIGDFTTLNHEIAHGIFCKHGTYNLLNNQHYYLMELEGSFFDFLSGMYLKGKVDDSIIKEIDYYRFITEYNDICEFYLIDYAVYLTLRNKNIDIISMERKILRDGLDINIDETNLHSALCESSREYAKYFLSYLTSLDLESIYEKDPEYAFYLFEKIRRNKTDDIFSNLRENGITFMDDGYQNLQKKIKTFGEIKL